VPGHYCANIYDETHFRRNIEEKTQYQLATEMDVALMKAYLRLDLDQVLNHEIQQSFQRVISPQS
jgi:hypothetical protein